MWTQFPPPPPPLEKISVCIPAMLLCTHHQLGRTFDFFANTNDRYTASMKEA